ncbi:MAG: DUF2058 family protein, partial [Gammaproteobacteria bacterium]
AERDREAVLVDNATAERSGAGDEGEEYAGYEVPDDLMW